MNPASPDARHAPEPHSWGVVFSPQVHLRDARRNAPIIGDAPEKGGPVLKFWQIALSSGIRSCGLHPALQRRATKRRRVNPASPDARHAPEPHSWGVVFSSQVHLRAAARPENRFSDISHYKPKALVSICFRFSSRNLPKESNGRTSKMRRSSLSNVRSN